MALSKRNAAKICIRHLLLDLDETLLDLCDLASVQSSFGSKRVVCYSACISNAISLQ